MDNRNELPDDEIIRALDRMTAALLTLAMETAESNRNGAIMTSTKMAVMTEFDNVLSQIVARE